MQSQAEAAETSPEVLWKQIMQSTQPIDLFRTILDQAAARSDGSVRTIEVTQSGPHPIVFQGCTVTIHQHVTSRPPADADASNPAIIAS